MKNIFTEHPHSIGETYLQHLYFAAKFGCKMIIGGIACLIHAVFPFLFKNTGSNFLFRMTHDFVYRMPVGEARVVALASSLLGKLCKTDKNYNAINASVGRKREEQYAD